MSLPAGRRAVGAYHGLVLALLAPILLIVGFVLLKPMPIFGTLVLGLAGWVATLAEDEDEAVLYRLVGWAVILAAGYLLLA